MPVFPLAAAASPAFAGSWSPLNLVILVTMVLVGVVLFVVLLVTGLSGGYVRYPRQEPPPPPPDGSIAAEYRAAAREAAGLPPEVTTPQSKAEPADAEPSALPAPPPARKTGLWQLLAALAMFLPALLVWNLVDNPTGRAAGFTLGTGLNLVLLAAQLFFIVWYVRLRKRL